VECLAAIPKFEYQFLLDSSYSVIPILSYESHSLHRTDLVMEALLQRLFRLANGLRRSETSRDVGDGVLTGFSEYARSNPTDEPDARHDGA
jgi:hypothetical protein